MVRTFLILTASLVCLTGVPGYTQSPLGLIYPFGIPVRGVSSISHSLGGTGVAIENDFLGAFNNPANLGSTQRTVFSSGADVNLLIIDDDGKKNRHLDASLFALSLAIPVSKFGTFSLSVNPESNPSVRFRSKYPFDETSLLPGVAENALYLPDSVETGILRQGTSLSWQVAWGYNLLRKARVGIALKRFNFSQSTSELVRVGGSMQRTFNDSTRILYHTNAVVGGLIVPVKQFSFGLTGEYYFIESTRSSHFIAGLNGDDTLESSRNYDLKPAPTLSFGTAWQINQQWLTAADLRYELWSRYYDEQASSHTLDDAVTVSGGVQFVPAPNLLTPKFYEITQYRAGLRYTQLPGALGREAAFTIGAGLPIQANGGLIDIIFEFAQRTDSRISEYHENSIGLKIGINAGRKWYRAGTHSY